jgi:hypothetical protein
MDLKTLIGGKPEEFLFMVPMLPVRFAKSKLKEKIWTTIY